MQTKLLPALKKAVENVKKEHASVDADIRAQALASARLSLRVRLLVADWMQLYELIKNDLTRNALGEGHQHFAGPQLGVSGHHRANLSRVD